MIKRLLSVILILILLLMALTVPTVAAGTAYVYNPYGIISLYDEQALGSQLSALNAGSEVSYYLVVSYFRSDVSEYARGDSVVLLIEYDEYERIYYYEIFTYGNAYYAISNREANRILDDAIVFNSIKSGNIRIGASRAFELVETAVSGKLRADNWLTKTILTSIIIAVIIAGIVCGIIIYKYKKKLKSPIYPIERYARLHLIPENSRDVFLHKTLTRVRINSSSGGGHGGRGGRGGRGGGSRGRR